MIIILFPRNEEVKVYVGRGVYETKNQPKKSIFKYEQGVLFCIGLAKVEIKEDWTITGKRCSVFDYKGKKIVTMYAYKKEILNNFARIRNITSSLSPWVEKNKSDKIWLLNL